MPFSAYNSSALRLLSAALAEALEALRKSSTQPLTPAEIAARSKWIVANLKRVYDRGERDPSALKRAALEGIPVSPRIGKSRKSA